MARLSRTRLLRRHDREEQRIGRPSDTRDWVPLADLDLTPAPVAPEVERRNAVKVTRLMAGAVR